MAAEHDHVHVNGTNGTNGTKGTNGTNGTSGTSGTSGTNGTSGTSGTNGDGRRLRRHAVILAGGPGTRIPPYTTPFPKPLVPVGQEHAVIEVVLRQLADQGFERVTIAVGILGDLVRAYCGDGSQWGISVDYWSEAEPLGTVGPIVANLAEVPDQFLVLNGDVLTDIDFRGLLDRHCRSRASLTVATCLRQTVCDFGVIETEDGGRRISAFWEKPERLITVSTGIYALSRSALVGYRAGAPLGFDELMVDLIEKGDAPTAEPFDGFFLDLGRAEEYEQANAEWTRLAGHLLPQG